MSFTRTCTVTLHQGAHLDVKSLDDRRSVSWDVARYVAEFNLIKDGKDGKARKHSICSQCVQVIQSRLETPNPQAQVAGPPVDSGSENYGG